MAKRKRTETPSVIHRRLKVEGRGKGQGKDYDPYLTIHDVSSHGWSYRIRGWKTRRVHHFLSDGELNCFYVFEWSPYIIDIQEQFPLNFDISQEIARKYRLRHPIDPNTRKPKVVTFDFRLKIRTEVGFRYDLVSFKTRDQLDSDEHERIFHEHEIQRLYALMKGWTWRITIDDQLPMTLIDNIKEIHSTRLSIKRYGLDQTTLEKIYEWLSARIVAHDRPLCDLTSDCDQFFDFKKPLSLRAAKYFIATRRWLIDMNCPFETGIPLHILAFDKEIIVDSAAR